MSRLLYGDSGRGSAPSKRVRAATATAILAIEPDLDVLGSTVPVDPTGTRRRIQALVALGWSFSNIADGVNVLPNNLGTTMRSPRVRAGTARAVRALYDQLWDQAPPENTHSEKLSASRARNRAKAADWAPPMAWNDHEIDDPKAKPHGVRAPEVAA